MPYSVSVVVGKQYCVTTEKMGVKSESPQVDYTYHLGDLGALNLSTPQSSQLSNE